MALRKVFKVFTKKAKRFVLFFVVSLVTIIVWFLGIDKVYVVEGCNACYWDHAFVTYRVFSMPLYKITIHESHSPIELISQDLRMPCEHVKYHKSQLKKWWGLICPTGTYQGSIISLGSNEPSWYNNEMRIKVKKMRDIEPELGAEFFQRVIENHELSYLDNLRVKLQTENLVNE